MKLNNFGIRYLIITVVLCNCIFDSKNKPNDLGSKVEGIWKSTKMDSDSLLRYKVIRNEKVETYFGYRNCLIKWRIDNFKISGDSITFTKDTTTFKSKFEWNEDTLILTTKDVGKESRDEYISDSSWKDQEVSFDRTLIHKLELLPNDSLYKSGIVYGDSMTIGIKYTIDSTKFDKYKYFVGIYYYNFPLIDLLFASENIIKENGEIYLGLNTKMLPPPHAYASGLYSYPFVVKISGYDCNNEPHSTEQSIRIDIPVHE